MSLDADAIVDRRRLKRQLIAWRLAAVAAFAALAYGAVVTYTDLGPGGLASGDEHVATMEVGGLILDDHDRLEALAEVARNKTAKALIVRIDSPGGTAVGGETLYHALRDVAGSKPVVALIRTMGTSGGYMTALAADRIYARETSLTGSIGVVLQTAEMSGLLEKIGVTAETLTSGPLKGQPSTTEPMTAQAREATQDLINDTHEWFVKLVSDRRKLSVEEIQLAADGRLFTGRQALAAKLIDELGGVADARRWLMDNHGISGKLPMFDVDIKIRSKGLLSRLLSSSGKTLLSERLTLDGLLTLWQPAGLF
jgi:protease IV